MKDIKQFITEKTEVDDFFKRQDEFKEKMINRWKSDDKLKPLDLYFKWKNHDITTEEWKKTPKAEVMKMMNVCRDLCDAEYDKENEDEELIQILDAVEMELINIIGLFK